MTRFNASSPKAKQVSAVRGAKQTDRSIYKKQPTSPTMKCFKNMSGNKQNHQFYISMLKTLVPNGEESLSEFEVIQRTIAYIKYLQNILGTSEKQDLTVLLEQLSVD
ncbi:uncharacterized protein [Dysidea avara]|uniref:uncharacterized protein isoform X2 n=1 Tax=Dysidea avara TaxID=196820 RepID=UPI003332C8D4